MVDEDINITITLQLKRLGHYWLDRIYQFNIETTTYHMGKKKRENIMIHIYWFVVELILRWARKHSPTNKFWFYIELLHITNYIITWCCNLIELAFSHRLTWHACFFQFVHNLSQSIISTVVNMLLWCQLNYLSTWLLLCGLAGWINERPRAQKLTSRRYNIRLAHL